jgi:hypothetical protein
MKWAGIRLTSKYVYEAGTVKYNGHSSSLAYNDKVIKNKGERSYENVVRCEKII